jgi:hypothetical protein
MTGTIELLENIGRDASLRRASPTHLTQMLSDLDASDGLIQAIQTGDSTFLAPELGPLTNEPPQTPVNSNIAWGDEEEDADDGVQTEDDNVPPESAP